MIPSISLDTWNTWSEESQKIPYTSEIKGVGHGEERVAYILKTKTLGQNMSYDMNLSIPGLNLKGEVKELDSANSFKSGKSGRDILRPIKSNIIKLQMQFESLKRMCNSQLTKTIQEKLDILLEMSPDEICESNITLLKNMCISMNTLKNDTEKTMHTFKGYDIFTGKPVEVSSTTYYRIMIANNKSLEEIKEKMGEDQYLKELLLDNLNHPYISNPLALSNDLDEIRIKLFNDITLIYVNNKKGFYIMTPTTIHTNLRFCRITMGYPRFKLVI